MLHACLVEIIEQCIRQLDKIDIGIMVVDNDCDGSAKSSFSKAATQSTVPISYVLEPKAGVGNARNAGIRQVPPGSWLLFFDDDQIPAEHWLETFVTAIYSGIQACYSGPVLPVLEAGLEAKWQQGLWAWGSGRDKYLDLQTLSTAGFGNFLAPSSVVSSALFQVPKDFLGATGEDTAVTAVLVKSGIQILFLKKALATEVVPLSRLRLSWVLRRNFKEGVTWGLVSRKYLNQGPRLVLSIVKQTFLALSFFVKPKQGSISKRLAMTLSKLSLCLGLVLAALRLAKP